MVDYLVADFFVVDCRGVEAFLDCGVAALVTEAGLLGIEAGFLADASFFAFATVTFLPVAFGFFSILAVGFFAGAFLDLG